MDYVDDWLYFTPNVENVYAITTYDNGNRVYEQYTNEWLIAGVWIGKRALVNAKDTSVKIASISKWKLSKLEPLE